MSRLSRGYVKPCIIYECRSLLASTRAKGTRRVLNPQKRAQPGGFALSDHQAQVSKRFISLRYIWCKLYCNLQLDSNDVLCLRTLLALSNSELNFLAFSQRLEAIARNSAEVCKINSIFSACRASSSERRCGRKILNLFCSSCFTFWSEFGSSSSPA